MTVETVYQKCLKYRLWKSHLINYSTRKRNEVLQVTIQEINCSLNSIYVLKFIIGYLAWVIVWNIRVALKVIKVYISFLNVWHDTIIWNILLSKPIGKINRFKKILNAPLCRASKASKQTQLNNSLAKGFWQNLLAIVSSASSERRRN